MVRRLAVALALVAAPAAAQSTVDFDGADGANCLPFACPSVSQRYQQVYGGSAFGSSPLTLTAVRFFGDESFPSAIVGATYSLRLSTTSRAVGALDASFDSNLGADNTVVYAAAVATTPLSAGAAFQFTFVTPFVFDPGAGNLLLDVTSTDLAVQPGARFLDATGNPLTSRMAESGGGAFGLRTQFVATSTVPEPATWMLLGTGLLAVGGCTRRRRRAAR